MKHREAYEEYLSGKSVCVVGPSSSMLDIERSSFATREDQVEKINSYDVIVRFNKTLPIPDTLAPFIGTRTDVLYNCMTPVENKMLYDIPYLSKEITWMVSSMPAKIPALFDINRFASINNNTVNFTIPRTEYWDVIEQELQTRPNTGVWAILDLLSCAISQLYITGVTFFKGGYMKEYKNFNEEQALAYLEKDGHHEQPPQIKLMRRILKSDKRVSMDRFLQEIIDG